MRDLPAHQAHQAEAEQKEDQRGNTVLDADDFVVGGKDVGAPKPAVRVVIVMRMVVGRCVACGLHVWLIVFWQQYRSAVAHLVQSSTIAISNNGK
jgi:hypothetical protein